MGLIAMTLTKLDLTVLAVYFAAIICSGLLFKNRFAGTRDYFAAGGNMLWWMAGFSAITGELSVYAFTGSAGRYASDGLLLLYANFCSIATVPLLYWLGPKFRRLHVTTALEAVGLRFGRGTEAFYSFLVIPLGVWAGGVGLHITATFFTAAAGVDKDTVVFVIGGFTVIMSALGGIWAVATSDLFQGGLTLFMMVVLAAHAAAHPNVKAAGGVFKSIPPDLIDPFLHSNPFTVAIWVLAMTMITLMSRLSVMHDGWKFIVAKNERECRRSVHVILALSIALSPLIALPSILSKPILGSAAVDSIQSSSEGVLAVLARSILPSGLIGLLLAGIVSAAMNSMDHALNRNAGFFVTSIYHKYINRSDSDKHELRVSRWTTLISGAIAIGVATLLNHFRHLSVFDFVLRTNSLVAIPLIIPLAAGILFRTAPGWSGWGGVIVAASTAWLIDGYLNAGIILHGVGINNPTPRDLTDTKLAVQILGSIALTAVFFAGAQALVKSRLKSGEHQSRMSFGGDGRPQSRNKTPAKRPDSSTGTLAGF